MARFGDGLAVDSDLLRAAEAASQQALAPLAGRRPDLGCVFVCGDDPDAVAAAGQRAVELTGAAVTVGCSAGGVIGAGHGVEARSSVSVWAALLPGARLRSFHLEVLRAADSLAVVGMPKRAHDDVVAILLADPYSFPADGFVEQSNDALDGLPLVGGLATGPRGPGSTRLFVDGRTVDRGAVGVVLGGPVAARTLVSQGCRPIGPTMVVTRAEGNVLLELAGTPALAKVEQIVSALPAGDQALATRGLQVGVAMDEYAEDHGAGDFLVRGVIGADRDRGAIAIGDVVEIGQTVRLHLRDADTADRDLDSLLRTFRDRRLLDPVEAALLFSCNGRGASLFPTPDHDVEAVRRGLGTHQVAGFFAAGEIGPVAGRNHLHGFTASLLAFGDAPAPGAGQPSSDAPPPAS